MKKILSLLLSLILVMGIMTSVPVTVYATYNEVKTVCVNSEDVPIKELSVFDGATVCGINNDGELTVYTVAKVNKEEGSVDYSFIVNDSESYKEVKTDDVVINNPPYEISGKYITGTGDTPEFRYYNGKYYFLVLLYKPDDTREYVYVETSDFDEFNYIGKRADTDTHTAWLIDYSCSDSVYSNKNLYVYVYYDWQEEKTQYWVSVDGGTSWKETVLPDMKTNIIVDKKEVVEDQRVHFAPFNEGLLIYKQTHNVIASYQQSWSSFYDIYYTEDFKTYKKVDTSILGTPEYDLDNYISVYAQTITTLSNDFLFVTEKTKSEGKDYGNYVEYYTTEANSRYYRIDKDDLKLKLVNEHSMLSCSDIMFTDLYGLMFNKNKVIINNNGTFIERNLTDRNIEFMGSHYNEEGGENPIRFALGMTDENELYYTDNLFETIFLVDLSSYLGGNAECVDYNNAQDLLLRDENNNYYFINAIDLGRYIENSHIHTSSSWITDKKATVNKAGSKHKECTECGETLETATIKQLKCDKPTLKKIENTADGVKITWAKETGADKYYVYRKTGSSGKYSKIATVKGNSKITYTDKSAKSGKKYYYYVKAVNEAGSSSASSSKSIYYLADTTLSTPKSTKSGITLKWKKVTGAEGYQVYRKTGSGSYEKIATVKGNAKVTYTDKKAKKGKTYTYKIKAYKSKNTSAYSNAKKIKDKY